MTNLKFAPPQEALEMMIKMDEEFLAKYPNHEEAEQLRKRDQQLRQFIAEAFNT